MKQLVFILCAVLAFQNTIAQDNPFEELGYTPRFGTLSNGKYQEFHDNDTIVNIGSVLLNTKTKEIIGFVEYEVRYSEATLEPDIVSRWLSPDPLAEEFPDWSPYNYVENSPIVLSDPTGLYPVHFATRVVNEETGETFDIDDGYDFEFVVSASDFAEITETGAIPKRLNWAWNKEFWRQVWAGVVKSDGSAVDEITAFLITDDIDFAFDVVGNREYAALALIPLNKLNKLKKLKKWVKKNNGKQIPGTKKGGVKFDNDGRGNGQVLPQKDANGKPITYKEYDINPAPSAGQTRGKERMVIGSDGKAYYTNDHYKTFTEIID